MEERAEIDLREKLSLDAAACLAIRRPGGACTVCAETCPAQAISIDARTIELDHDLCTGCARCVAACPTGAMNLLVPLHQARASLVLECSRVAHGDQKTGAQVVPCLGGVSREQLLETIAAGDGATLVDRGWCLDCPSGGCAAPWTKAVQSVHADLSILGADTNRLRVVSRPTPHVHAQQAPQPRRPKGQDYSRRQLFRRLTTPPPTPDRSRVTAQQPFSGKVDAPALEMRRDLFRAMHGTDSLPAAHFPSVDCARTPDMRLAASLCPTKALTLREDPGADCLIFDAALCIACGECETADGLRVRMQGEGIYRGAVTLARQPMAECPGCQRRFAPRHGQRDCDACHKDTDLAASAFGLMRRTQAPYGA